MTSGGRFRSSDVGGHPIRDAERRAALEPMAGQGRRTGRAAARTDALRDYLGWRRTPGVARVRARDPLGRGEPRRRLENPREFPQGTIDRGCDPIVERRIAREHLENGRVQCLEKSIQLGLVDSDIGRSTSIDPPSSWRPRVCAVVNSY